MLSFDNRQQELDSRLVTICSLWSDSNTEELEEVISQGANINCCLSDLPKNNPIGLLYSYTPLTAAISSAYISIREIKEIVQILLEKGADPSIPDSYGRTPLYYALSLIHSPDHTNGLIIFNNLLSRIREDIDKMQRGLNGYDCTSVLGHAFIDLHPRRLETMKILLNKGANPNLIPKDLVNSFLHFELLRKPDFVILLLAKGCELDEIGKETLRRSSILGFFVQDKIEINGFFQNARSDSELINNIIHVGQLAKNDAQRLAYKMWVSHGIEEILEHGTNRRIIGDFLTAKCAATLATVVDVLSGYLTNADVKALFFTSLLSLEKRSEQSQRMINDLSMFSLDNAHSLNNFLGIGSNTAFYRQEARRKQTTEKKLEESLYDIRYLYEEAEKGYKDSDTQPILEEVSLVASKDSKLLSNAQGNGEQSNYPDKNNPAPQNEKSKLPVIAASMLAITGVTTGIAIAVYLEMLAVGITVGACCLVIASIIYYCNKPSKLLENSNAEAVVNQTTVQNIT
ncbi:MAG: hypothetical protein KFE24_07295 [Wolbachia endosymbiont of Homalodisca vitripennis]|nr:hypothetical protein [Wolbachia endosymbiont of Homalodisca vitripennis]MBR9984125.1 hypothetical protein [Wolbachia endosymbiont of Homalodisca vitripennis]MBR9984126.1 hypothetical protein [Wolbachia endosymbiont of Homalodisca vitripennis]MBR9984128.1 hypothetical protein [Wolbachia endosymbiont of Homalodisca vitripennis]MCJ7476000.1 hypothetical protein [Wolbachia endosymbiont of Homalodisca vitripennis]